MIRGMINLKRNKFFSFAITTVLALLLAAPPANVSAENVSFAHKGDFYHIDHFSSVNTKSVQTEGNTPGHKIVYGSSIGDSLGLTDFQIESLKKEIHSAVENRKTVINVSSYYIPFDLSITDLIISLIGADPENIAADVNGYYSFKLNYIKYYYAVQVDYFSDSQIEEMKSAADILLEGLDSDLLTDAEKALIVHDRLAVNCRYNMTDTDSLPPESYQAYGALVQKTAVCEGYSKAYMYLMNRLGICTEMVSSNVLNHAWNIVNINGERYHTDVSHDDTIPDLLGRVYHDFFLVSTNTLLKRGDYKANDYDKSPKSDYYINAPWASVSSNFIIYKNNIYFISDDGKLNRLKNEKSEIILSLSCYEDAVWYGTESGDYWEGFFGMLSCDEKYIYFNLAKHIYRYAPGETEAKIFYTPGEVKNSKIDSIYRFVIDGDDFRYIVSSDPNELNSEPVRQLNYQAVFTAQSVTLRGDIGMNFCMKLGNKAKTDDAYFEYKIDGLNGITKKISLSDVKPDKDGIYTFSCPVNVLQMADTITAGYHYKNHSVQITTSVSEYITKIVENAATGDENCIRAKPLVQALADYGYFAQKSLADEHKFTLGTDHKSMFLYNNNPDITADLSEFKDIQKGQPESIGAEKISYSLALDSKTDIVVYFQMKNGQGLSESDIVCSTSLKTAFKKTDDGNYTFTISDISASELDKSFNITVKNGKWSIDISAFSYAYNVLSGKSSENDKNTCTALYKYYLEAKKYTA